MAAGGGWLQEANRWDWDKPLAEYVTAIQTGAGETGTTTTKTHTLTHARSPSQPASLSTVGPVVALPPTWPFVTHRLPAWAMMVAGG